MSSNENLDKRRVQAVARGLASATAIYANKSDNVSVWDVEGRKFIDFAGGIGVLNTGHRHPKIMAAMEKQCQNLVHTCFQILPYESYVELAEKLNSLTPGDFPKKSIFLSTGAEAVENAVKIARMSTGRQGIISFSGAFHGRTMMGMALTGKIVPYKVGFGPFPAEVYHAPFPHEYRGVTVEDAIAGIEKIFKTDIEASRVAAIIVEPVQGEGGFVPAPFDFLKKLREICDQNGILLIADEVQSGFGRTGKLFAMEHSGVIPDITTVAKSLAGGMPLSGVIGRADVMDSPDPGGLGGTYGGNPVACASALAVIDVIESENLLQRSLEIGERVRHYVNQMIKDGFSCIGEIRGLGGMIAFELVKDQESRSPDPDLTKALTTKAAENGLILLSCGTFGNTVRVLVPLTASTEELDEGLDIMKKSLKEVWL